jgi:hypothetical protein
MSKENLDGPDGSGRNTVFPKAGIPMVAPHRIGDRKFGHPEFYKLLDQMADLHSRKNHDYAGTSDPLKNLRACERLEIDPFMGVLVRLQDKWSRIEEFAKQGVMLVKDESVEDTLMDNAVYSLLAIILRREAKAASEQRSGIASRDHGDGTR